MLINMTLHLRALHICDTWFKPDDRKQMKLVYIENIYTYHKKDRIYIENNIACIRVFVRIIRNRKYLFNYCKFFPDFYESTYGIIYILVRMCCANLNTNSCFIFWYHGIAEADDINAFLCKKKISILNAMKRVINLYKGNARYCIYFTVLHFMSSGIL